MDSSAQERGLRAIAATIGAIIPPSMEAVILIYHPSEPKDVSSVMVTRTNDGDLEAFERGRGAANAFIDRPPNYPGFNTRL